MHVLNLESEQVGYDGDMGSLPSDEKQKTRVDSGDFNKVNKLTSKKISLSSVNGLMISV